MKNGLCNGLNKARQDKSQVIPWIEAMPECTCDKSCHASAEPGLLSFGGNSKIDIVSEPIVCVDVPTAKICSSILSRFDTPRAYIAESIPRYFPRNGIYPFVTEAG